ncbi:Insulin-like peptide [Holothuria leucospilota]|uniref:Insulin-like peptide n=1 Tax=Holothuria leucospilota TaxID=206669 RepID=A0A9Q1BS18_HOLLE|nr:Insulin-like peptide [Holothuria leucospilota]
MHLNQMCKTLAYLSLSLMSLVLSSDGTGQKYCGEALVEALAFVCGDRGYYGMTSGVHGRSVSRSPFLTEERANSFLTNDRTRNRRRTGRIVTECCENYCTTRILESYCNFATELPTELSTERTTTEPSASPRRNSRHAGADITPDGETPRKSNSGRNRGNANRHSEDTLEDNVDETVTHPTETEELPRPNADRDNRGKGSRDNQNQQRNNCRNSKKKGSNKKGNRKCRPGNEDLASEDRGNRRPPSAATATESADSLSGSRGGRGSDHQTGRDSDRQSSRNNGGKGKGNRNQHRNQTEEDFERDVASENGHGSRQRGGGEEGGGGRRRNNGGSSQRGGASNSNAGTNTGNSQRTPGKPKKPKKGSSRRNQNQGAEEADENTPAVSDEQSGSRNRVTPTQTDNNEGPSRGGKGKEGGNKLSKAEKKRQRKLLRQQEKERRKQARKTKSSKKGKKGSKTQGERERRTTVRWNDGEDRSRRHVPREQFTPTKPRTNYQTVPRTSIFDQTKHNKIDPHRAKHRKMSRNGKQLSRTRSKSSLLKPR